MPETLKFPRIYKDSTVFLDKLTEYNAKCRFKARRIDARGQRESFFHSRDESESFSDSKSRTSRQDRKFLTLNLRLRDETEKKSPPISGIEGDRDLLSSVE